ncbi:hypothetical protein PCIT_a3806 [Pseudoalteromonas citrea]|uniref:Uncharacterized protein n=1 Tax=Pseudoalteromonas citrea TaxID=43655 RepID=A0AAD4AGG9_9GAMM|nr:hypothetical protein PCIT_a3806 [Pseudoalteromonas citrea]
MFAFTPPSKRVITVFKKVYIYHFSLALTEASDELFST